ncbi:MAG: hypothetical protein HRU39_11980 [Salinicola sp.]|uniref:hypothetical protein n=1 Tax=Salinicola sp. TaxID=1978524 RepID=UPI001E0CA810|nr:hypothetical protein [Salinicola sp.]NRB56680.1 hypothetical protein [Salinicola sp.]
MFSFKIELLLIGIPPYARLRGGVVVLDRRKLPGRGLKEPRSPGQAFEASTVRPGSEGVLSIIGATAQEPTPAPRGSSLVTARPRSSRSTVRGGVDAL